MNAEWGRGTLIASSKTLRRTVRQPLVLNASHHDRRDHAPSRIAAPVVPLAGSDLPIAGQGVHETVSSRDRRVGVSPALVTLLNSGACR